MSQSLPAASCLIVIPARMASNRLPGKPLADIAGKPMIVQVMERAIEADVGSVLVACAEPEIAWEVETAGGRAIMTDPELPSGSDRIWQACQELGTQAEIIVNVQGDLPTLEPSVIRAVLEPLLKPLPNGRVCDIATVAAPIHGESERTNPNVVKIAMAGDGKAPVAQALYFSRATIPANDGPCFHHIGIYAYRREALKKFVSLPPSVLEQREKLEQLRALEAGMTIGVALVDTVPLGVDTPEDLERARAVLAAGLAK